MLAAVVLVFGLVGTGSAQAKSIPGTLSINAKTVPSGFGPEEIEHGFPATGKALTGRLNSDAPACERNRPLFVSYLWAIFDEPGAKPTVLDLSDETGRPLTTRANGSWKTGPLGFLAFPHPIRVYVSVFVKKRGVCAKATSPTITVRAVFIGAGS
jgi:hypothetical protein